MSETTLGAAAPGAGAGRGARWIGNLAGALLGLVLLYSAWGKALDPHGTADIYVRKGLLPAGIGTLVIVLAVALEAGLGAALLAFLRRPLVLAAATALMLGFFGLTTYEYFYPAKDASSCGCFGNLIVRSPAQAVIGDGAFVLLAFAAWIGRPRSAGPVRWAVAVAASVAAGLFALVAPRLPVDGLATLLKPGVKVRETRIDELLPELQRGLSFVMLIDRADPATRARVPHLNEVLDPDQNQHVKVLALAEENEQLKGEFMWGAAPAFEVRDAPYTTLKPLYRTLPRCFLVKDGVVQKVWNGIPDDTTLGAIAAGRTP